jgi:uncharacterized membrane protein
MRSVSPSCDAAAAGSPSTPSTQPMPPMLAAKPDEACKRWRLTAGCDFTPRAFMLHLGASLLALLLVTCTLAVLGNTVAAVICGINALLLVAGGMFYAVHVADGEQVLLYEDRLVVLLHRGLRTRSYSFNPCWAHFECGRGDDAGYYWLRCGDVRLPLGHHLAPVPRCMAVAEITTALLDCHQWEQPERLRAPAAT